MKLRSGCGIIAKCLPSGEQIAATERYYFSIKSFTVKHITNRTAIWIERKMLCQLADVIYITNRQQ